MKAATKKVKMPTLQAALDRESYEWLASNVPAILEALEVEVSRGVEPGAALAAGGKAHATGGRVRWIRARIAVCWNLRSSWRCLPSCCWRSWRR